MRSKLKIKHKINAFKFDLLDYIFLIFIFFYSLFLWHYMLDKPFHLDTVLYYKNVRDFKNISSFQCGFKIRCFVSYYLLFFKLIGFKNPLKVGMFFSYLLFIVLYYLFLKRLFDKKVALISSILISLTPSVFLTVFFLKEDFIALSFLFLSFYILFFFNFKFKRNKTMKLSSLILSSLSFLFALWSKQMVIVFLPYLFLIILYSKLCSKKQKSSNFVFNFNKDLNYLWFSLIDFLLFIFLLFVFNFVLFKKNYLDFFFHDANSIYLGGKFLGLLSGAIPFNHFQMAYGFGSNLIDLVILLSAFYLIYLIYSLIYELKKKKISFDVLLQFIFTFYGLFFLIYMLNQIIVRYRHFLWVFIFLIPGFFKFLFITFDFLFISLQKIKNKSNWINLILRYKDIFILMLFLVFLFFIALNNLSKIYPNVVLRHHFNTEYEFYHNFKQYIDLYFPNKNIILYGMDDCGLATYYTGFQCKSTFVDPDENKINTLIEEINSDLKKGYLVFLLPDFYGYDQYNLKLNALMNSFNFNPIYQNWYENYHSIDYGYTIEEMEKYFSLQLDSFCSIFESPVKDVAINDLKLTLFLFQSNCFGKLIVMKFKDRYFQISPNYIFQLKLKS